MTYNLLKGALDASSLRQKVISSNISNINTPNYKTNRVIFESHLKNAIGGIELQHTNKGHIYLENACSAEIVKQNNTYVKDNGNNVDIDFEMAELSANNIYYDSLVSQLNAKYQMMRNIIQ